jgi:hypothetical protein
MPCCLIQWLWISGEREWPAGQPMMQAARRGSAMTMLRHCEEGAARRSNLRRMRMSKRNGIASLRSQ